MIDKSVWDKYISTLRMLNETAARKVLAKIEELEQMGRSEEELKKELIDYAYAVATTYGEGSAAAACEMYDALAEVQGAKVPPAIPADPPSYRDVAKTVNGTRKFSQNPNVTADAVSRLVKRTGADTTVNNAIRDGAEWAWIPHGDTCAFCLTLASRGWQKASKKALKNGHAEHIHAHCDCTYAIRFDSKMEVEGYDPDALLDKYYGAEGNTPQERINSMRRANYAENRERINAQKRAAYARSKEVALYTRDDPMREVLGAAEDSHPEEMEAIQKRLRDEGVKVIRRDGTMAYQPNVRPGTSGQIVMEEGASYSAWLHEMQHFDDDKESGFRGFRLFADPEKAVEMERKAYDVEIELARSLGYNDIAKRLEILKAERIEEL